MRGTVLHGPRDVRYEEREAPRITKPTDAIIRISATCVCGSDLWPYRGIEWIAQPTPMGHEYCGIVEEVGSAVTSVKPGSAVVVVGDGAVGLLAVLSAKQMGAERIVAMSRHETRQKLAREFGATDIFAERGDAGVERIKEMTKGIGADAVLECVGSQESMMQAIRSTRPGGFVSYVGVPHGVELNGGKLFHSHVHLHGGPAPVRRYLPRLINLIWNRTINPGRVFDLTLPLEQVAEGYRAMDERRAIKALLRP